MWQLLLECFPLKFLRSDSFGYADVFVTHIGGKKPPICVYEYYYSLLCINPWQLHLIG